MQESRTINSVKNFGAGFFLQLINKIILFVCRTVFISILNTEYLGVNGLFTNILSILSFAELGIGTAIIYSMYKPIANNDKEKVKSLLSLYKKSYNIRTKIRGTTLFYRTLYSFYVNAIYDFSHNLH